MKLRLTLADGQEFLTTDEVAELFKTSKRTLENWRHDGARDPGLPWCKIGGLIRYLRSDVEAFINGILNREDC